MDGLLQCQGCEQLLRRESKAVDCGASSCGDLLSGHRYHFYGSETRHVLAPDLERLGGRAVGGASLS